MDVTNMLRNFAAANAVFKRMDAKVALDMTPDQINRACDTLLRQGYIERIGHGMYKSNTVVEKPRCDVTDKLWRAMKVKKVFSYADLAMLANTSKAYIYKLFRKYRAEGYIKPAGARKTYGSGTEKMFRLTLKGQNKARTPNVETFKPDPLVMDAVNLNRLVCSGLVVREERAALEAVGLCERIIKVLNEDMEK